MKLYVGLTDINWFQFLASRQPEEVNFWKPGGRLFQAIEPGELFLFRLKRTKYIGGGGFFVKSIKLNLAMAWNVFGYNNGMPDYETFRTEILSYRQGQESNPEIGCVILAEPFFFPETDWIPEPEDWSSNLVQGKSYSLQTDIGKRLWEQVQEKLRKVAPQNTSPNVEQQEQYSIGLAKHRLGQGAFRILVTEAYRGICAVTGEKTLPALVAAHIKPYALNGPHDVKNGLLLRADIHQLFDQGYMTVTENYRVEVSQRIKEEYDNGKTYYAMHGNEILLPPNKNLSPAKEYILWHNEHIYLA